MKSFQYEIRGAIGLEDTTAGLLVREASKSKSEVVLECNGKTGDAKRLFSVKNMNIQKGDNIAVLIEGNDETPTAESLEKFFHDYL